ncbi:MAG: phytanoyl-CoA dioxygenase family protein [Gammaproteobacteria bacterium]|nr:phytanoyl-CoA dioxygenase family protein [Gammaproteobacteria bacterium]
MNNFDLTDQQIAAFRTDGFIAVAQIISPEEVALVRERYEELFQGRWETGLMPDEVNWREGRDPPDHTRQICNGWKADRYLASVLLQPAIGRACARLGGWPGARLRQDNVLWKPPGGKPLGFHQDAAYEQWTTIPDGVSCWIALDDTTAAGGTVEYVRGSHRWGQAGMIEQFHAPENPTTDLLKAAARAGAEVVERVPIVVKAGGGAFHSGWIWHGSDVNRRAVPRRALVAHCMSSATQFDPHHVGAIYSRYKRFGDNQMDESYFPTLWREDGYRTPFIEPYTRRLINWGAAVPP